MHGLWKAFIQPNGYCYQRFSWWLVLFPLQFTSWYSLFQIFLLPPPCLWHFLFKVGLFLVAAAQIYARLNVNTSSWISFSRSNASFRQLHLFLWASPGKPGNFNKIQIISGSGRMPDLHKLIWDFAANYSGPETLCPQKCLFSVRAFSCTFFLRKSKGEREKNGDMEGRALTNFPMKKPIWILLHPHPNVTTLVEPHNPNNIHPMPPVFTVPEITGDAKAFLSLCPGAPLPPRPILCATLLK